MYEIICENQIEVKNNYLIKESKKSNCNIYKCTELYRQLAKNLFKTPLVKMAGIALKGQCDFVSIMVPLMVSLKE